MRRCHHDPTSRSLAFPPILFQWISIILPNSNPILLPKEDRFYPKASAKSLKRPIILLDPHVLLLGPGLLIYLFFLRVGEFTLVYLNFYAK